MRSRLTGHGAFGLRAAAAVAVVVSLVALVSGLVACGGKSAAADTGRKVIVLGFDGLDFELTQRLMAEGRMPNFSRLAESGGFAPLETSVPPQSPVAWSNFITGMDSGGHGIFDFVHRDPATMLPYLSTSKTEDASRVLKLGKYQFAISGGEVKLLRHGTPFWKLLEDHDIETTIIRIPANFPPSGTATRELSGMGTPDLLGTSGTFSFFTSELFAFQGEDISGGEVYEVYPYDNMVEASLFGPDNPALQDKEKIELPFTVYLDPEEDAAKLEVGDSELVLKVGEWSEWVPIDFELIPTRTVPAIVRFFLKQVHPELELYASPLNFDPMEPAMSISTPDDYSAELAEATGRYYTQEMPEDTKILSAGIFSRDEFLAQARLDADQFLDQYEYVLGSVPDRSSVLLLRQLDQTSHMLMKSLDSDHPAFDPEVDPKYAHVIEDLYIELDGVVGYTLENMPVGSKLVVMSDHGFTSWRRSFNLNTWLMGNGYAAPRESQSPERPGLALERGLVEDAGVRDWASTGSTSI